MSDLEKRVEQLETGLANANTEIAKLADKQREIAESVEESKDIAKRALTLLKLIISENKPDEHHQN